MAKEETQAFIPTKTIDCSFSDVLAVICILSILFLFTVAGIIVGSFSAKNNDSCSKTLPYGDTQSFTLQYNTSTLSTIYITGDTKTSIYFDPSLKNKIEVTFERTSLLDKTYTNINNSVYLTTNGSDYITISSKIPSTDFTNCYFVSRIIRIPATLTTISMQASVYANNFYIGPDPSLTNSTMLSIKALTIMGGTNLLNMTQIQAGQFVVSGRKGQIYLSNIFAAIFVTSTTGDIYYKDLSSAVSLKLYTSKGALEGSNIQMLGSSGNVTLIANKKKQVHNGIKGAKVLEVGTVESDIDVTLGKDDFVGELQIQSPNLDTSAISQTYHTVTQYSSLTSRKNYPTSFGGDAAEIFTPTYAGYIGDESNSYSRLLKLRFKTSGKLIKLSV
ncbi:hypothetical protein NAEGRDRAFT_58251 [Naegleria gruberi]|uniref:Adhesin domain-containing protein n=1 Tax=Naegleria gruberi TaxID=5762 RepID=D2VHR5_NAEGR|nr:uncharacterized protein NAEGRDRAFT_58251 [Naegleria gruberi]EFC43719.1 hypothetical protein NAEGRDRAFT_58251 [Naegleria gruberi]|eukprot:XP_002676463.1 hypothetical protein NAEGRDRAFT_58251 [Naegleria gruberi strain NEG-M]